MSSNPLCCGNSVHWLKVDGSFWGSGLSTVVTPTWSHNHVSLSGCVTLAAWNVIGRLTCLADSLARHHGRQYFSTNPSPSEILKRYYREHCREACRDLHPVRAPNSRSGGHEFESPMRWELGALTKSGKILGPGLSTIRTNMQVRG